MTLARDVLKHLLPKGGWVIVGEEYEGISFLECEPITKQEFIDGFAKYEKWKAEQDKIEADKKSAVEAKLAALGLTIEDLRVLGLG